MKNRLLQHFAQLTTLSLDEEHAIIASMEVQEVARGQHLITEGQYDALTYFVLDGLLREYTIVDGKEVTTNFYPENSWALPLEHQKAAQLSVQAVETCQLVLGNEEKAQVLFEQFPRLESVSRAVMEAVFKQQQVFKLRFQTSSPEQRYLQLLAQEGNLLQRVPQYQIASYLGIQPETLSRIRKRLRTKG